MSTYILIGLIGSIYGAPHDGASGVIQKLIDCPAEYRYVMFAAPIGTFLCYLVTMIFNFFFVAKKIKYVPSIGKIFIKPFISALVCAATAFAVFNFFPVSSSIVRTILAVFAAAAVYFVLIFVMKTLDEEDVLLLPKGEKILGVLRKLKFVR